MANIWDDWNNEDQTDVLSWDEFDKNKRRQAMIEQLKQKNATAPNKGNFLTNLIPTAGGIGGTLAGAASGAAIGSVVPILGTAVGGLIGGVLGGAGGSALGKVGENAVEGNDLGEGVGGEAVLGGLTSTPIGAGFKLARAGLKATTGIGKRAAGELVQEAGMSTIGRGTVKRRLDNTLADRGTGIIDERGLDAMSRLNATAMAKRGSTGIAQGADSQFSAGGKLRAMGDKALLSQYGTISKPIARSTRPTQTIANLANMGITKPADAERIASRFTGSDGIVNKAVLESIDGAGGVDTSTLRQVFNDAIDNYGLVEKDAASIRQIFEAQINRLAGGAKGSLSATANPTDAGVMMKALEKRIANLTGKGDNYRLSTPERGDQASVLSLVRDELEDKLYEGAGANANLAKVLTPKFRQDLIALQPNNAKWLAHVDNNVMTAKTVGNLRSTMSPFVRVGKIIEEGDTNALTAGGRLGNAFAGNGVINALGGAATELIKNPIARVAGNTLRAAGGAAPGIVGQKAIKPVGQGVVGLTARQGGARLLTADSPVEDPMGQIDENGLTEADYMELEQAGLGDPMQGAMDDPMQDQATEPSNPFGVSLQDVATQMRSALQNGDTKGYATLSDMYDRIAEYESTSTQGADMSATTQQALATSSNALGTLDQLEGLYQATGNGSGKIGGAVQNFLGGVGLDDNAASYNALAESATSQLAKAINGGGQVSDADAAALIKALPQITDNPEKAAALFAALRQRLQNSQQNTMQFNSGGTDLASILSSLGQ